MEKTKRLSPNITISDCPSQVFCTKFSPDNSFLAAGCGDGAIRIFHAKNGSLAYTLMNPNPSGMPYTAIRFRPLRNATKNVLLAVNADGCIQHWHITSRKCLHTIYNEQNQLYALDYHSNGTQFAVAGRDYAVHVFDEKTRTEIAIMKGGSGTKSAGHSNRVFSLKYHPKMEHILISGGWDDTIQIWDTRIGLSVRGIFGPHLAGDAVDINDQNEILTGSWRGEDPLELWDFSSGKRICGIPWHQSTFKGEACFLYAAQFSKSGADQLIAAGGSGSNEAKLFYRDDTKILGTIAGQKHGVFSLDFSSTGEQIAVGGADAAIRIVDIIDSSKFH